MIPPRPAIVACAALALVLAWRRPYLRPVAVALAACAGIDCVRLLHLPARIDAAVWLSWPGVGAAFAWRAWRGKDEGPAIASEPRTPSARVGRATVTLARTLAQPWALVAASFALYALACVSAPWSWAAHPDAWTVARTVPYWVAPGLSALAWALRKNAGAHPRLGRAVAHVERGESSRAAFSGRYPCHADGDQSPPGSAQPNAPDPAAQASRRVAALLAASATLDAIVLLPSLSAATWAVAYPLAWTTWAACAVALLLGARR